MGLRRLLVVVLALAAMLQMIVPVRALALDGGNLVEICSEYGVEVIRIDASGNPVDTDGTPCPDCGDCVLCNLAVSFDLPSETAFAAGERLTAIVRASETQFRTKNPAQVWADCRGPPRNTQKATDLAMKLTMGSALIAGRTPCI